MTRLLLFMALLITSPAFAQFTPDLLQNNSYWADGKAEFNIYDARIVRDGILRACEVVHILVREPCDARQLVRSAAPSPVNQTKA